MAKKQLTGFSVPLGGVQWADVPDDRTTAKAVVAFLEDRRVLFGSRHTEDQMHCLASVFAIRAFLTDRLVADYNIGAELTDTLKAMRACCRRFIEAAGPDGEEFLSDRQAPGAADPFSLALGDLRTSLCFYVAGLARLYTIPVDEELAAILPVPQEDDDISDVDTRIPRLMYDETSLVGDLTLGHVLRAAGIDLADVVVLRHTYTSQGLRGPEDLTAARVLEYTQWQSIGNKLRPDPPKLWVIVVADGQRRSRLLTVYENCGEVLARRHEQPQRSRLFDLRPTEALSALAGRLVIEWSRDAVNWAKTGAQAGSFPVVEIADPERISFPGFDHVLLTHAELQAVATESRYRDWRTALGAVQGIYLIADASTGQLYVGKADGQERVLGRWTDYANDGHGGNIALKHLTDLDPNHARHYRYSLLRVFGPSVSTADIDQAEAHFKQALLTRQHGLNLN